MLRAREHLFQVLVLPRLRRYLIKSIDAKSSLVDTFALGFGGVLDARKLTSTCSGGSKRSAVLIERLGDFRTGPRIHELNVRCGVE